MNQKNLKQEYEEILALINNVKSKRDSNEPTDSYEDKNMGRWLYRVHELSELLRLERAR